MRVLHLLRRPAGATTRAVVEREVRSGDSVVVVLTGPDASFPEMPGVRVLPGPGWPHGIDGGRLHDLIFECDRVVGW
jgi:hypothetical protein